MKKIINNPKDYLNEMLEGIYIAHHDKVIPLNEDLQCYVTRHPKKNKVGIATGGGSGHLPLFLGYVGDGLLDGCAVGDVFQSPSAEQMFEITKYIDQGAGVLYIYGNYNGDIFNFDMASEMANFEENIIVTTVLGSDDVASALDEKHSRRGVAGIFFVFKCAGAAAENMMDLENVTRIATKASENVRTMGVALSPCIVPRVGKPGFSLNDNEMEIGMGIHGETGIRRGQLETADNITSEMLTSIISDLPFIQGDEVAVLINGLGATPLDEQYIVVRRVNQILLEHNLKPYRYYVGEFATSLEMAGLSISLLKLDDELKPLLDHPVNTPFFKQV